MLGSEVLVTRFNIDAKYIHDITVQGYGIGNAITNGRGVDLTLDLHRNAPYGTLFSNLDVGAGRRVFDASGRGDRGAHAGAHTTYWNIRVRCCGCLSLRLSV